MHSDLAVITGASRGIGRAVSLAAAAAKIPVFITGRNNENLQSLCRELEAAGGCCQSKTADLSNPDAIKDLAEKISMLNLPIGMLVHCAGVAHVAKIEKFEFSKWQENLSVNLTAPFFLTQQLLPLMHKDSHIFFLNSVAGKKTFPEWAGYSVSKHGLRALADTLRSEISGAGIKVTTVFPASVDTPMHDELPYDWDRKKMLQAQEVASAILFCFKQSPDTLITDIDIENIAGTF